MWLITIKALSFGLVMSCTPPATARSGNQTISPGAFSQPQSVPVSIDGNMLPESAAPEVTVPPDLGSDPEELIRHDFESAVSLGTANALCLFIRHNAGHPLAAKARRLLWKEYRIDGTEVRPCPGPDI